MAIVISDKTTKLDFGNRLLPAIHSSEIGATDYGHWIMRVSTEDIRFPTRYENDTRPDGEIPAVGAQPLVISWLEQEDGEAK